MKPDNERTPLRKAVDWLIAKGKISKDADLIDIMELSKGTISSYLSGRPGKAFIEKFQTKFGLNLADFEEEKEPEVKGDLTKTILDLIEITKQQAEITRIQAETADKHAVARMREAENNAKLIAMLEKKQGITAGVDPQIQTALSAKIDGVLGLLLRVSKGTRFHSDEEALAVYHKEAADALQEA